MCVSFFIMWGVSLQFDVLWARQYHGVNGVFAVDCNVLCSGMNGNEEIGGKV